MDNIYDIKRSLQDINITQTKLAKILDTNLTTVNNWFSRGSIPKKHHNKIYQLLNKPKEISNIEQNSAIDTQNRQNEHKNEHRVDKDRDIDKYTIKNRDDHIEHLFYIDKHLMGNKSEHNLRWDKIIDNIHIIDINVDKYTGDGLYYLQYPHKLESVDIRYLPFEKCYMVKGVKELYKISNLNDVDNIIKGKVIYKIVSF